MNKHKSIRGSGLIVVSGRYVCDARKLAFLASALISIVDLVLNIECTVS